MKEFNFNQTSELLKMLQIWQQEVVALDGPAMDVNFHSGHTISVYMAHDNAFEDEGKDNTSSRLFTIYLYNYSFDTACETMRKIRTALDKILAKYEAEDAENAAKLKELKRLAEESALKELKNKEAALC